MAKGHTILIVDDDEAIRGLLRDLLTANGHEVEAAENARSASDMLKSREFELVLTDLMLPDGDGLEVLRMARARPCEPEVLVITAYGTIDSAVEAVRAGAFDYLTKPVSTQKLLLTVDRAIERRTLRNEVNNLRREVGERYADEGLVAASPGMRRVLELVDIVAAADSAILIQGESGTGKELVARAIHFRGARAARPFIAINCAALPEALLESELFGYAKGAFTGAAAERKGLFEEADGGTLLLDEIADMPLLLQGKLLRVLQEGEIRRVGSTTVRRVDVRILASTNRRLPDLIHEGKFREDLFYRLNVIPIEIPPLRDRPEDIIPLCRHFLTVYGRKIGRSPQSLSPEALEAVLDNSWPGNIRELENVIERAVTLSSSPVISADEFRTIFTLGNVSPRSVAAPSRTVGTLQGAERETIIRALRQAEGNQTRAAVALGMGRNTLWRKMKKYRIEGRKMDSRSVP
ncbi:MAG: sigma-54 dependent transcriptional regulator [Spirochaetia bacterium]|jgi:DNA-binding NtrC family response regulator